jgi:ubiquinone/menaquinone biosynthesis C-methylase UbiE
MSSLQEYYDRLRHMAEELIRNHFDGVNMSFDWACNLIVKRQRFQESERILEIGGGDFSRTFSLALHFPEKNFFSVDFDYSTKAIANVQKFAHVKNANIIKLDAVKSIFADSFFDFAFSSAVGEHIADLKEFLFELSRVLRVDGEYYFVQSPFWTSFKGHHFRHSDARVVEILGGYKHLLLNEEEMRHYLLSCGSLPVDIEKAIEFIYRRRDLSRLSMSETKRIIQQQSNFLIEDWVDIEDECFDETSAKKVVALNSERYTISDLKVKGSIVSCVNKKSETIAVLGMAEGNSGEKKNISA